MSIRYIHKPEAQKISITCVTSVILFSYITMTGVIFYFFWWGVFSLCYFLDFVLIVPLAQSAGAVEYTDCTSAEG